MIKLKSAYTKALSEDGERILIDLFWPEGLKTHEAQIDEWRQELGPSYDLQRFHFSLENWETYKSMYIKELLSTKEKRNRIEALANRSRNGTLTFLYGNNDPDHNSACVLKELIETDYLSRQSE